MKTNITITLRVNGRSMRLSAPPMKRLLDVLREEAHLTGAKEGCGEGECGACSVLMSGMPVNSCLVPFGQCEGARIVNQRNGAAELFGKQGFGGQMEPITWQIRHQQGLAALIIDHRRNA